MAATRTPNRQPEWMADGFPPRSFPVEAPRSQAMPVAGQLHQDAPVGPPPEVRSPRRGAGRWVAAVAVLIAALLLGAGLLLANRGDDDPDVAVGTGTTAPGFDPGTTLVTPSSLEPVTAPSTAPSTLRPGVLDVPLRTLTIPRAESTAGPRAARLTLRNRGAMALSYTTQASSTALAASPAQGTIAAGGTAELTVTLDGSKVTSEGPFKATLSIGGTGGGKVVQISSIVGQAPSILDNVAPRCPPTTTTCSTQIGVAPAPRTDASPCNTTWLYAVTVTDQSPVKAKVVARLGQSNADAELLSGGGVGGAKEIFLSRPMQPLGAGAVLRFMTEAVDQHGFVARLPEQSIRC